MPHTDKYGRQLKVGDRVFIPAIIVGLSEKETDHHNAIVHTEEAVDLSRLSFPVNSKQVEFRGFNGEWLGDGHRDREKYEAIQARQAELLAQSRSTTSSPESETASEEKPEAAPAAPEAEEKA